MRFLWLLGGIRCMVSSEHKIMRVMEFFVNKMGWDSSFLARSPILIGFSLEKRIVPRCAMYQVLLLKGLIKNNSFNLTTMLKKHEKWFLTKVVNCHEEEAPELLKLYKDKLALAKKIAYRDVSFDTNSTNNCPVVLLLLSVEIGDLKPDPALWHEDNGRKPWENRRQDPPGSISGWHLGNAANRLVANSLQLRANRNGYINEEKKMCVRSAEASGRSEEDS
ncbi:5'-3' exoribonuclease 3 [Camellia lanceoleosa]|nr:5'-3' exoribonuclease 3 [Camellia lanceoleosa]